MNNFYKFKHEIKKMFWNRERAVTLFFLPVAEQYVYVIKYVTSHTQKRLLIITILGVNSLLFGAKDTLCVTVWTLVTV